MQDFSGVELSEAQPRPGKPSRNRRAKNSAVESMPSKRGRPRIDVSDTPAERRRTQIRVAQRAYRQRKETTISELRQKVRSLEQNIATMGTSFSELNKNVNGAGSTHTSLSVDYGDTVEQLHDLAQNGEHESPESNQIEQASLPDTDSWSSTDARALLEYTGTSSEQGQGLSTELNAATEPLPLLDYQSAFQIDSVSTDPRSGLNFFSKQEEKLPMVAWDAPGPTPLFTKVKTVQPCYGECQGMQDATVDSEVDVAQWHDLVSGGTQQYGIPDPQMRPSMAVNEPQIGNELPLPLTYNHYETSFVRRLIRASLEESYRLLMNPGSRPEDLQRLCTFAFCFIKAPTMLRLFQDVMRRTARDNLELWTVPLYHVGDAGLHYRRAGIDASSERPAWWANRGSMGPFPVPEPENPVPKGIVDILEYSGVDGEWFDSNDVVEYLGSKGLHLDINSSVVEITDSDETITQGQGQRQAVSSQNISAFDNGSALSSMTTNPLFADNTFLQREFNLSNFQSPVPKNSSSTISTCSFETIALGGDPANFTGMVPQFQMTTRRFLDVEKFLKFLTRSTTCLGRTICFRRAYVDAALQQATTELFDGDEYLR